MRGYFMSIDVLGFKNIINNLGTNEYQKRVDQWAKLIVATAKKYGIEKVQFISDTVFIAVEENTVELKQLLLLSKELLEKGILQSFPMRGGISYGEFSWGEITHGKAVVRSHELEQSQNWIGVTLDLPKENLDQFYEEKLLCCYPVPHKSGLVKLSPVIVWKVPPYDKLLKCLGQGGLSKPHELITHEFYTKITNTLTFDIYLGIIFELNAAFKNFHGTHPLQTIQLKILGQLQAAKES